MTKYRKTTELIAILILTLQLSGMSSVDMNIVETLPADQQDLFKKSVHAIGGGANFVRLGSDIVLNIITSSLPRSRIHHTVYVYKNGILIHGKAYNSVNGQVVFTNSLTFPAKDGDYFQTYVTHYVSKDGITETMESYKSATFKIAS